MCVLFIYLRVLVGSVGFVLLCVCVGAGVCLCCVYFLVSNCLWDPVCFIVEAKFVGLILL